MVSREVAVLLVAVGVAFAGSYRPAVAGEAQPAGTAVFQVVGHIPDSAEKYFTVNLRGGTTRAAAAHVVDYFRGFGLEATPTKHSDVIFVHGTYAQAARAAHTSFARVRVRSEVFTHATVPESYPPGVAEHILAATIEEGPSAISAGDEIAPAGGYSPADIAEYYDIAPLYRAGLNGTGQQVAILACASILPSDISAFESAFGLPANQPTIVPVDGGGTTSNNLEPTGDVERVIGTAPGVAVTLYVVPNACSYGQLADGFAKIASDDATMHFAAVTHSYGATEDDYAFYNGSQQMAAEHADLKTLHKQSTPVFTVSGDWGASFDSSSQALYDGELTVWYPTSDNEVISVGGTEAPSVSPKRPQRVEELAWGDSGGGVSVDFKIPPWQKNVPGIASATMRNVPDIALDSSAEAAYAAVWTSNGKQGNYWFYGTSFAAPTWAGFIALVEQARTAAGKPQLSNLIGDLYRLGAASRGFTDITEGCNGYYCAAPGYDNVTGLGVLKGAQLEADLLRAR